MLNTHVATLGTSTSVAHGKVKHPLLCVKICYASISNDIDVIQNLVRRSHFRVNARLLEKQWF